MKNDDFLVVRLFKKIKLFGSPTDTIPTHIKRLVIISASRQQQVIEAGINEFPHIPFKKNATQFITNFVLHGHEENILFITITTG